MENNVVKEKNKSKKSIAVVSLSLVLLVCVFFLAVSALTDTDTGTDILPEEESVQIESEKKEGFPLSFSGQIDAVTLSENTVYALTNNEITLLSSNGNYISDYILNFTDPMVKSSSAYAIAYDRKGSKYRLFDRKGIIYEGESESKRQIITATVADDGKYLIASRSEEAASELTYYTRGGEVVFRWLCTNEHIVSCDISPNGNNLICAALYSDEGKILTKVYYFDISSSGNNKEYTFKSAAAVDCFFTSSRNAVVVCTDRRIFVKCTRDSFEPLVNEYPSEILKRATDEKGNTAVLTAKPDDVESLCLTLYSNTNQIVFETDVPSDINDIACYGKKVYLLTDEKVIKVSDFDKSEDVIITESSCSKLKANRNGLYYYTNTTIYCN